VSTIGKVVLYVSNSSTCPHSMVNFCLVMAEIRSAVSGTPTNFNGFRVLASLLQRHRSPDVNQTLHDVRLWAVVPNRILPGAKFTLRPSLGFSSIGRVTARHCMEQCASVKLCGVVQGMDLPLAPRHFEHRAQPIFRGRPSRWA